MSVTVLIGFPEHLPRLKQGPLSSALAFSHDDTLAALAAINEHRPGVVALQEQFVATARGAALIERIKADPQLQHCEVRIVSCPDEISTPDDTAAALDMRGTRRAPRFRIAKATEIEIDGQPATLVDLSLVGAQVITATRLNPMQRVRVTLIEGDTTWRARSAIAWVSLEIVGGTPRYRAGLEFMNADKATVQRIIDARSKRR
jgi:hypothetical protein